MQRKLIKLNIPDSIVYVSDEGQGKQMSLLLIADENARKIKRATRFVFIAQ